jgi:hypothetical protein
MSDHHILFENLEPDEPIDMVHLEACSKCRAEYRMRAFVSMASKAAPDIEVPPFFSARVTALIKSDRLPVLFYFERAARQLVPLLLALVLTTGLALYTFTQGPAVDLRTEALFGEPGGDEVYMEYVVNSLVGLPEEGGE